VQGERQKREAAEDALISREAAQDALQEEVEEMSREMKKIKLAGLSGAGVLQVIQFSCSVKPILC